MVFESFVRVQDTSLTKFPENETKRPKDRKEDQYFRGFMQFPHAGNSHYLSGCHRESYTLSMGDTLQLWEGHECPLSAGSQWEGLAWTGVMLLPHEFVKLEQSLALQHRYSRVSRCHTLIFTVSCRNCEKTWPPLERFGRSVERNLSTRMACNRYHTNLAGSLINGTVSIPTDSSIASAVGSGGLSHRWERRLLETSQLGKHRSATRKNKLERLIEQ